MTNYEPRPDKVHVSAYERDDGTDVREYWRAYPGGSLMRKASEFEFNTTKKMIPLFAMNYLNARSRLAFALLDKDADVINSRSQITNKHITNFLNLAQVPNNSRVVFYYPSSNFSQQLSNAREIKNYANTNYLRLKSGALMDTPTQIEFTAKLDNYLGIQHATLIEPRIDKEGYFNAFLIDYYDFTKRKASDSVFVKDLQYKGIQNFTSTENLIQLGKDGTKDIIHKGAILANNHGYSLQEKNQLENYVIIYYIHTKV